MVDVVDEFEEVEHETPRRSSPYPSVSSDICESFRLRPALVVVVEVVVAEVASGGISGGYEAADVKTSSSSSSEGTRRWPLTPPLFRRLPLFNVNSSAAIMGVDVVDAAAVDVVVTVNVYNW